MDIQLLPENVSNGFNPSEQFERAEDEVVAPGPSTTCLVKSMQSNGQAYRNIKDQSELHDQTFLDEDETKLFHMLFDDAQTSEAESIGSNRQAYTNIGDQSEQYDQTFFDLDQSSIAMLENENVQTNEAEFMGGNGHASTNTGDQREHYDIQTFLDLDETNLDQALFAMLENDEAQTNEAHVQTNCTPKKMRKRIAIEPALYVDVIKTCTACSSHEVQFKHLNNNKLTQPRYKCLACKKLFVHNPTSKRRKHPEGYKKSRESEALQNAVKMCPNPKCRKVGFSKFLYYNNKNLSQPRYKCRACGVNFQYRGQFANCEELQEHAHMVEPNETSTVSNTIVGQEAFPTKVSQHDLKMQEFIRFVEHELLET